jgi:hypothetical protein
MGLKIVGYAADSILQMLVVPITRSFASLCVPLRETLIPDGAARVSANPSRKSKGIPYRTSGRARLRPSREGVQNTVIAASMVLWFYLRQAILPVCQSGKHYENT